METREQTARQDIEGRLKKSNRKLWDSLSIEARVAAVNKYYELRSVEVLGIQKVLDSYNSQAKDTGFLIVGLGLGIFGNLFADVVEKYLPDLAATDLAVVAGFALLLAGFIYSIEKWTSEDMGNDKILEYLVAESNKNEND